MTQEIVFTDWIIVEGVKEALETVHRIYEERGDAEYAMEAFDRVIDETREKIRVKETELLKVWGHPEQIVKVAFGSTPIPHIWEFRVLIMDSLENRVVDDRRFLVNSRTYDVEEF